MNGPTELTSANKEVVLISLAREIAQDIYPIEDILKAHKLNQTDFETIAKLPRFQEYLAEAIRVWNATASTAERVKLRAGTMIELSLPEMYARLHDRAEALNHKVELLKILARIAEIGERGAQAGQTSNGERISITINMGADKELKVAAELPPRVIDAEMVGAE